MKKKIMSLFFSRFGELGIGFLLATSVMNNVYGNNLALSAIVVNQATSKVTFTITWQNSWRLAVGTPPYNWDAVWMFVKFRDCSANPNNTQYTHGALSVTLANHNFDGNSDGAQVEPTTSDGVTIPGIDADLKGVLLRRTSVGAGAVTETVILNVTNLPAAGTLDVKVFGIEMVFIPGGGAGPYPSYFNVGDGDGTNYSSQSFTENCGGGLNAAIITSEAARYVFPASACGQYNLTAAFPKGWNSFYIMKYEITQGQYTDFLNAVAADQAANTLFPGTYGQNRHRINNIGLVPQMYTCDVGAVSKGDRACNFLGWKQVTSYFDWACLRPLTELQYEKAARGFTTKVAYGYAWGTTTGTYPAAAGISGAENGTETITTANANISAGNIVYTSGDLQNGPLRVGIFTTAATINRQQTGASYFGVMEMSGNVSEFYVAAVSGVSGQPSATGISWGDGTLVTSLTPINGTHNVADWPDAAVPSTNIIRRGGNFSQSTMGGMWSTFNISFRSEGSNPNQDYGTGGRGGR